MFAPFKSIAEQVDRTGEFEHLNSDQDEGILKCSGLTQYLPLVKDSRRIGIANSIVVTR